MPEKDSILILSDSAQLVMDSLLYRDSVLSADSIARVDSIARADSIALHAFKGYDGVLAVGAPSDQNWVFLVLLFMFGVFVVSFLRSISSPLNIFTTFFNSKDRGSIFHKTSIDNIEQKFYFFVISVTSISLFSYLAFHQQAKAFSFFVYIQFVVVVLLFFLVKYISTKLISYIFIDNGIVKSLLDNYLNVVYFVSILFYPIMLFHLYAKDVSLELIPVSGLIIMSLGLFLVAVKLVQIFLHKVVVSLYLLLYLCTLEILPVIIVIQVFQYLSKLV